MRSNKIKDVSGDHSQLNLLHTDNAVEFIEETPDDQHY